jgi:hypothetical protein
VLGYLLQVVESIDGFLPRTSGIGRNTTYRHQIVNPLMAEADMVNTGNDAIDVATNGAPNPLIQDHASLDIVKAMGMTKQIGLEYLL